MRSFCMSLIMLFSAAAANAGAPEIMNEAITRCVTWMHDVDDQSLSPGWSRSHVHIVPNSEGGPGEITKEFHHPEYGIVIQISQRPASGNRSCSVLSRETAFNTLDSEELSRFPPDAARRSISSWMAEAGDSQDYKSIPQVGWFNRSLLSCDTGMEMIAGSMTEAASVSEYMPWLISFIRDHKSVRMCAP